MDKIIELIKNGKRFALVGHEKPDGDAMGSVIGLSHFLLDNGCEVLPIILDELPTKFQNLVNINIKKNITLDEINNCDCLITLDCAKEARINLPKDISLSDIKVPIVNIDHHIDNDVAGTINYVDFKSAANSQIIANLVKLLEDNHSYVVSKECAEFLYLGIVSDTGSFKFSNTTSETFTAASYLFSKNIDNEKIVNAIYFSKPLKQLEFESAMISKCLHLECENRFAYVIFTQEFLDENNFDMRNGDNLIEYLREIDSAVIVSIIYPFNDIIKVSLRSKNSDFPVGPIARIFGGGGHQMAAGISFKDATLAEVEEKLLNKVKESLNNEI